MKPAIYTFPSYAQQGEQLAEALKLPCYPISIHHFPDKESRVTLPEIKNEHVIFCLSLDYPNNKLIELFFAAKTARQQGAKKLTLIAPYLCYMRQDTAFHSGEVISQQIIGQWLSDLFDDILTVDPHLHRVNSLDAVIPNTNNIVATATPLLGDFVSSLKQTVFLLGPDEESLQWVKQVAAISDSSYAVATKKRHGDTHVSIQLPDAKYQDQHIMLIDDVISTGHTVAETALQLYQQGAKQVDVLVTHALFTDEAMHTLKKAKIKNIYSSDSIPHESNRISLTNLLANCMKTIF